MWISGRAHNAGGPGVPQGFSYHNISAQEIKNHSQACSLFIEQEQIEHRQQMFADYEKWRQKAEDRYQLEREERMLLRNGTFWFLRSMCIILALLTSSKFIPNGLKTSHNKYSQKEPN